MCWVNEWNSRYFAVVRDENCSDLKTAQSLNVYGSKIVSSPLHVHVLWTGFSTLVTHFCTLPGIRCEMQNGLQESSQWPRVSCGRKQAEIIKTFLKNTVCCKVSYLNGTIQNNKFQTVQKKMIHKCTETVIEGQT